ncbi:hypothetical protein AX27061_4060 [Achromobacter xylosoxidans NBRC 15126 = ATCC 27061]|nr:hypothetical protein AX27061_4060 [Achromobacter xylosoxidans NBRC 15126 = ATCC 27061]
MRTASARMSLVGGKKARGIREGVGQILQYDRWQMAVCHLL